MRWAVYCGGDAEEGRQGVEVDFLGLADFGERVLGGDVVFAAVEAGYGELEGEDGVD